MGDLLVEILVALVADALAGFYEDWLGTIVVGKLPVHVGPWAVILVGVVFLSIFPNVLQVEDVSHFSC